MKQVEVKRRQIQLISYILGLIVLWVMGRSLGDNGVAYLVTALECFGIVWCIAGNSIADVLGRILRSKQSKGQYKDAHNMRRNIFLLQSVIGAVGSVLLFIGAGVLTEGLFRMPYSKFILLLIAPTVFLKTMEAILLGCFQGDGSELPTAAASVLRPFFLLGFGILFGKILGGYGSKVSALLKVEAFEAMYCAMGIAIAFTLTELLLVLFLLLLYRGSRRTRRQGEEEGMKTTERLWAHVHLLYSGMGGKLLLHLLETLPLWLGLIFYQKSQSDMGLSAVSYGVYVGKYLLLCGIAVLVTLIVQVGFHARVGYCVRKEEERRAKGAFQGGLKNTVIYALYFAVFAGIMAKQLAEVFGGAGSELLGEMLQLGSAWIAFAALAFYFSRTMLLFDKWYFVPACAGAADVVFVLCTVLLLNGESGIMSLVLAGMIATCIYAVAMGFLICRQLKVNIDWIHTIAIPASCAAVIGLFCLLLGKVFTPHLGAGITLLICLVLSVLLYWGVLFVLKKKIAKPGK